MWLKTFVSVLLCLCGTCFGVENGDDGVVRVKEGSDAVLPCSLKNQDLNYELFDWNKVDPNGRKEVFLYDAGEHYNNGRGGQDHQFKGRVSRFEDELQHGNASIKISNTKVEDSGNYTCYFPRIDQIFHVKLVVDWILKDISGSPGPSDVRVFVKEGSDVVLPCSLKNQNLNSALFDWNKVEPNGRKEVFLYEAGKHYNNGRGGQDHQFKGRVSHFGDELQHGNASIKISNTKVEDSGNYTCYFPRLQPPQIFRVELVVDGILKDRSGSPGVTPAPDIKTVNATDDWSLLQCDVRGAFPKPTVEWKNSDGKVLHTQEPQVTESEGRYDVTLLITVDQTGLYRCVVTQEKLHHQIHSETFVYISGSDIPWQGYLISGFVGLVIGWFTFGLAIGVIIFVAPKRISAVMRGPATDGSAASKAEFKKVLKVDDDAEDQVQRV